MWVTYDLAEPLLMAAFCAHKDATTQRVFFLRLVPAAVKFVAQPGEGRDWLVQLTTGSDRTEESCPTPQHILDLLHHVKGSVTRGGKKKNINARPRAAEWLTSQLAA